MTAPTPPASVAALVALIVKAQQTGTVTGLYKVYRPNGRGVGRRVGVAVTTKRGKK